MNSLLHFSRFKFQPKEKQGVSIAKVMSLLICVLCVQASVHAQHYHTYHNADTINPILNATPKPQGIIGMQFFDVDGDKDLDCYMTTARSDKPLLYRNVGTLKRPEYQLSDSGGFADVTLVPSRSKQFGFYDMDNDGDLDFFYVGSRSGSPATANRDIIEVYKNDGTPTKPHYMDAGQNSILPYTGSGTFWHYLVFQDIDGDGDLDYAFSCEINSLNTQTVNGVYLDTTTSGPATLTQTYYGTEVIPNRLAFYDFSGDGLPDCLMTGYTAPHTTFYPNKGTPTAPSIDIYHGVPPGPSFGDFSVTTAVDLNNDGVPEVFNLQGNYETAVPVPVLKVTTTHNGGKTVTKLSATTQLPGYKYKWERNGKIVKGNTRPTINASQPGKYVLYITDTVGTGVSLPYITPAPATSTGSQLIVSTKPALQAVTAQVYPNPFVQSITLKITGSSSSISRTIRISDMSGKVWLTQTASSSTVQLGATLPKGMYQVEVWEKNAMVYHTKILKQ